MMTTSKCPICKAAVDPAAPTLPFCSARCRQIDLGRWLGEQYAVPVPRQDSDEGGQPDEEATSD